MEIPQQTNIKLTPGNCKQKGRRTAPKSDQRLTGKDNPIAYRFKDVRVGEFDVLNSSRGWWVKENGRVQLQKLVDAYCFYFTDDEAISYAGVSLEQLKYFQELHPEFYTIKHLAKKQPDIHAKKKLVEKAREDVQWAAWWLSRTQKELFSTRVENTGANGRDLYEGLSQDIKNLGEELRNIKYDEQQEYSGTNDARDNDARQNGDGNETISAENKSSNN